MKRIFFNISLLFDVLFLLALAYLVSEYYNDPAKDINKYDAYASWKSLKVNEDTIRSGDIILRESRGFFSQTFKSFSLVDKRYSHSGVIIRDTVDNKLYVYHCVGGEENKTNKMKKDPIEVFCTPESNYAFGIYRFDLPQTEMKGFITQVKEYYKQKMEFDLDMELATDNELYCSEMIYKSLKKATGKDFIPLTQAFGATYVALDNLYLNDITTKIYTKHY